MTISRARPSAGSRAFTLVEMLVATGVSGIVLAGVLAANLHLMRSGTRLAQYGEMEAQIRRGLEQFGGEARVASDVVWNSASDVTLSVPNAAGTVSSVTYAWSSATQTFFRVPGASSTATSGRLVLARGIAAPAGGGTGVTFERLDRLGAACTTNAATKTLRVSFATTRKTQTVAGTAQRGAAVFTLRNKIAP